MRKKSLTLESLVDIDGLLGTRLKVGNVALGLAKGHRALVGNLDKLVTVQILMSCRSTHHSLALVDINLVANDNLQNDRLALFHPTDSAARPPTNGKLGGSRGEAWIRNSSRQLSRASKLFALLTS